MKKRESRSLLLSTHILQNPLLLAPVLSSTGTMGRRSMFPPNFLSLLHESSDFLFPACEMVLVKWKKSSNKWRLYFEGIGTCFCISQEEICLSTKWVKNTTSSTTTLKECRRWKMPHHYQPVPACWSLLSRPALGEPLLQSDSGFQDIVPLSHSPDLLVTAIQCHGPAFSTNHVSLRSQQLINAFLQGSRFQNPGTSTQGSPLPSSELPFSLRRPETMKEKKQRKWNVENEETGIFDPGPLKLVTASLCNARQHW